MEEKIKPVNKDSDKTLLLKYFPGDPDSPTVGQIEALSYVRNGEKIPEEVRGAVIKASERYQDRLEETIKIWNEGVQRGIAIPNAYAWGFRCLIATSYGQLENLEKRAGLIDLVMNRVCKNEKSVH